VKLHIDFIPTMLLHFISIMKYCFNFHSLNQSLMFQTISDYIVHAYHYMELENNLNLSDMRQLHSIYNGRPMELLNDTYKSLLEHIPYECSIHWKMESTLVKILSFILLPRSHPILFPSQKFPEILELKLIDITLFSDRATKVLALFNDRMSLQSLPQLFLHLHPHLILTLTVIHTTGPKAF
jgi:hypothetical protein